jgi:hypothetical protein
VDQRNGLFGLVPVAEVANTLTDEQILAILEFFKSNWGEQERTSQREATDRHVAANSSGRR